jgi:hypothetical protein
MKTLPMTAFVLFAGVSAVWLAATIDPLMFLGSACGATHCWRCGALAADLAILVTAAIRQIIPKPVWH